jgi:hypothetical protein
MIPLQDVPPSSAAAGKRLRTKVENRLVVMVGAIEGADKVRLDL